MATIAATFYPTNNATDITGGSDVRAMEESAEATDTTTICSHPNSAGTTSITADPYTNRSTQDDSRTSYGWVLNDSLFDSNADSKRIIQAGVWQFSVSLTNGGSSALGSSSVYVSARVYRVSSGGTRTTLFTFPNTGTVSNGLLGAANTATVTANSASQPEYIFEAGETIHVGLLTTHTQVAAILGGTAAGTDVVNTGSSTFVTVPGNGVRTQYFRTLDADGKGVSTQQPKAVAKTISRAGEGVGTVGREWQAYRSFDSTGEGVSSLGREWVAFRSFDSTGEGQSTQQPKTVKKPLDAIGEGGATQLPKTVYKPIDFTGIGVATLGSKSIIKDTYDAVGVGTTTFGRIVTFVRQFDATGAGEISSFRLCLDADDLPVAGGGGGSVGMSRSRVVNK